MRLLAGLVAVPVLLALGAARLRSGRSRPPPTAALPPPVGAEETRATLAALRPTQRARPLVAIVGLNDATEVTDYLMPYGILAARGSRRRGGARHRPRAGPALPGARGRAGRDDGRSSTQRIRTAPTT